MTKWKVEIVRKQKWTRIVEADSEEKAREHAEDCVSEEEPDDSWGYDTKVWRAADDAEADYAT